VLYGLSLPGPVLLAEDDDNDVLLVQSTFARARLENAIHVVRSGVAAVTFLSGDAPYHDRGEHPLPALVLLDIKMPGMDGFEVLKWIRQQASFATLPVVMLTGCDEIGMVSKAYELGATSFLVKPLDFWNAAELMHALQKASIQAKVRGSKFQSSSGSG
jgi:CheY-like chemotaxis protein